MRPINQEHFTLPYFIQVNTLFATFPFRTLTLHYITVLWAACT